MDEPQPLLCEGNREPVRPRCGRSGGRTVRWPVKWATSSATVGASKIVRIGISTPCAARIRLTTRVARSEWPPIVKKLSSTPTRSSPRTPAKISQSDSSSEVHGGRPRLAAAYSGTGSAARSSLPFGVSGTRPIGTIADGTMYSGSVFDRYSRRTAGSAVMPAAAAGSLIQVPAAATGR